MHTLITGRGEANLTVFNYNSDLSGDVIIQHGSKKIALPAAHLLEFVAEFVRREKISRMEVASDMQVLMGDAG